MNLRPAARTDVDAILPLLMELADNGFRVDVRYRLRDHRRALLRAHVLESWFGRFLPFPPCWVAEHDGQIVGMVSGEPLVVHAVMDQPPTAAITDLWVQPPFRRRGIARQLVETFREAATKAGYLRVELSTLARDEQALAFWRAMGFVDLRVTLSLESPAE
ncbi:MAG: GNAT family N-acetyltransferase [Myxococcota bacterium]